MKSISSIIILLGLHLAVTDSQNVSSSTPTIEPTLGATLLPVVSNPLISPNETEWVAAILTSPKWVGETPRNMNFMTTLKGWFLIQFFSVDLPMESTWTVDIRDNESFRLSLLTPYLRFYLTVFLSITR